jgi:hypothetical protein
MMDIDIELEGDAWLAHHRDRVDTFYAKGLDFHPVRGCSACDIHNDYICFEHELQQLKESENEI